MIVADYMTKRIRTEDDAILFIKTLADDGKLFHFDDSPEEVVTGVEMRRVFTDEECEVLAERVDEMFAIEGFDPFEVAVDLID